MKLLHDLQQQLADERDTLSLERNLVAVFAERSLDKSSDPEEDARHFEALASRFPQSEVWPAAAARARAAMAARDEFRRALEGATTRSEEAA